MPHTTSPTIIQRILACALAPLLGLGVCAGLLAGLQPHSIQAQAGDGLEPGLAASAMPSLILTGDAPNTAFGVSIATAGDVNQDGYADLLIGADGYDDARGIVYLYLGSSGSLSDTQVITVTGENDLDLFGYSARAAGDVNGDGFGDVVVGAFGYAGFDRQGRAYVYLGHAGGITTTPAVTLTGEATVNYFGLSVAWAGDIDNDGFDDLLIGAPGTSSFDVVGRVYVYMGSAGGLSATPALTFTGASSADAFGDKVGAAGDVNQDGFADVFIVAADAFSDAGQVLIFHGSAAGLNPAPALTLTGQNPSDSLGRDSAAAGDVNADGYADLIVGARGYLSSTGRAYVHLGGPGGLSPSPILTLTGAAAGDYFGTSVGDAGDANGDGYADVLIGALGHLSGTGLALLFHGAAHGLLASPALTITGQQPGDNIGSRVAGAGDINGDGLDDFLVSGPAYASYTGLVYFFYAAGGPATPTPTPTLLPGSTPSATLTPTPTPTRTPTPLLAVYLPLLIR